MFISRLIGCFCVLFSVTLLMVPQSAFAAEKKDVFKSSEFLQTWDRLTQESYIRVSMGMAILIADQNDKEQGTCITDWFAGDEQSAYNFILATMKRFPTYHPRGTILAVMEKKCGEFTYK